MQKAIETYDAMENLAGVYETGKAPLAPVGHIVMKARIEITINIDGRFIAASLAPKNSMIIIPASEKSAGRTSNSRNLAPHALCEQLSYLLGDDEKKLTSFIDGLRQWTQSEYSHPKAEAVLKYMEKRTLRRDLENANISTKNEKDLVCWRVIGMGDDGGPVWKDASLMKKYTEYYLSQKQQGAKCVCMLTGENTVAASKHLKGVFSQKGNAKIISSNDIDKYRGRFVEAKEALTVGYIASQKAHNAIKWLISNQGTIHGDRAFVCWNPQGNSVPQPTLPWISQTGSESGSTTYKSYREDLRKQIAGYTINWSPFAQVVIAAFDAATKGRLAITYYNELLGSDFMERLAYWDETCCWKDDYWGVRSPLLDKIIAYAFGTQQGKKGEVEPDKKIIAPQMQRLLSCRIDQVKFPLDIMQAIVARAERLQNYTKTHRNALLVTACAVIRKCYIDHRKEEYDLALEAKKNDRSYQWGRILAVMEKIERDTYDPDEAREPNAIRMQSMFVRRPAYVFEIVMKQLKQAYYPKLNVGRRIAYERLIGEINEELSKNSDYCKPLRETYLLGYYLQKSALYKKNDHETEANNDEV